MDSPDKQTKHIGKGMIIAAWILLLVLLTSPGSSMTGWNNSTTRTGRFPAQLPQTKSPRSGCNAIVTGTMLPAVK